MTQIYVYNGKEVYLTGRAAVKGGRRERVLYEVRLKKYINRDTDDPNITSDWVERKELYQIVEVEDNDEEKT